MPWRGFFMRTLNRKPAAPFRAPPAPDSRLPRRPPHFGKRQFKPLERGKRHLRVPASAACRRIFPFEQLKRFQAPLLRIDNSIVRNPERLVLLKLQFPVRSPASRAHDLHRQVGGNSNGLIPNQHLFPLPTEKNRYPDAEPCIQKEHGQWLAAKCPAGASRRDSRASSSVAIPPTHAQPSGRRSRVSRHRRVPSEHPRDHPLIGGTVPPSI